jgi:Zn-dependent protease with chaperone function
MATAAALLALLAVVLAWPLPIALSAARWPAHAPGAALLLWQAVALAGGLSMIGALLTFGLAPFGAHPVAAVGGFADALVDGTLPAGTTFPQMFALSGAGLLGAHLLLNLALTIVRTRRQQLRHLQLVQLLSTPLPDQPGVRLLDHEAPIAYCLPATPRSVTVLSAGLLSVLDEAQVRAVVAHEQAHVDQRHHLVLVAFEAWRSALPWFPIATRALDSVGLLVEMLADDAARRTTTAATLASAIRVIGSAGTTDGSASSGDPTGPAVDPDSIERRGARLTTGFHPLAQPARAAVVVAAGALVVGPTLLLVTSSLY